LRFLETFVAVLFHGPGRFMKPMAPTKARFKGVPLQKDTVLMTATPKILIDFQ
jgi:hypothetical protein